jgi:hypothetical protein
MALLGSMIGLMMTLTLMMVRYSVLLVVWMFRLMVLLGQMCVAGANAAAHRARSTRRLR